MKLTNRNFASFIIAVTIVWFLLRDTLQQLLSFQGSFSSPLLPFVGFGLPSFIFFFFAGFALRLIAKENLMKGISLSILIFCLIQIGITVMFTRSIIFSLIGLFIMAAPLIGIALGLTIGANAFRMFRWRPQPAQPSEAPPGKK